jgi:hypothetical protein
MRAVLLVQLLLAFSMGVSTDGQTVRRPKPTAPVKPPLGTTFTGCLAKSSTHAKEYELTVTSVSATGTSTASKTYRLMPVAAGVKLDEHVGHRVTITGSQTGATANKQPAQGAKTQTQTQPQPQVRVTDVHHVAPDCK